MLFLQLKVVTVSSTIKKNIDGCLIDIFIPTEILKMHYDNSCSFN